MIEVNGLPIDYNTVPVNYMRESVMLWIERGICTGSFLTAFLKNDLKETVRNADTENRYKLAEWITWFYSKAPSGCWGSVAAFERWQHKMENQR